MKHPKTVALCCACGTTRTVAIVGRSAIARQEPTASDWGRRAGGDRCVVDRKCRRGGVTTLHAYLRDDERRDELESRQRYLDSLQDEAARDAEVIEHELRRLGVRVATAPATDRSSDVFWAQTLDDGEYHLRIREDVPPLARLGVLGMIAESLWTEHPHKRPWMTVRPATKAGGPPMPYTVFSVQCGVDVDHPEPPELGTINAE